MDGQLVTGLESIIALIPKQKRPKLTRRMKNYDLKMVDEIKSYVQGLQQTNSQANGLFAADRDSPKFTEHVSLENTPLLPTQDGHAAELVSKIQ